MCITMLVLDETDISERLTRVDLDTGPTQHGKRSEGIASQEAVSPLTATSHLDPHYSSANRLSFLLSSQSDCALPSNQAMYVSYKRYHTICNSDSKFSSSAPAT